jgi:TonB family protein
VQSAGYGLDAKAEEAAQQYRFAPATKDGQPVPVRITVVMTFKLN